LSQQIGQPTTMKSEEETKGESTWTTVWRLLGPKGEAGVGLKKGKQGQLSQELKPGRWRLVIWSDDVRAGKGPCSIVGTVELFNAGGKQVAIEKLSVAKSGRKAKLQFVVAEEGDNIPTNAKVTISCGALLKKVHVYAALSHSEAISDTSKFNPESSLMDLSQLPPKKKACLEAVLAEWPAIEDAVSMTYDHSKELAELQRQSEYKDRAFDCGMIRPFLLLVSMHPKRRILWAQTLDLDLLSKSFFGDTHAEAWFIIDKDRKGIQARSNLAFRESLNPFAHSCNWYEIVERVTRKSFHKEKKLSKEMKDEIKNAKKSFSQTIGACLDPKDTMVPFLEELFLRAFNSAMSQGFNEQQKQLAEQLMQREDAKELAKRMRDAGWTNKEFIDLTVSQTIQNMNKESMLHGVVDLASKKAETGALDAAKVGISAVQLLFLAPVPVLPAFMLVRNVLGAVWGSTPGRLIPMITGLLAQRIWLTLGSIRIEDYYPSPEKK